MNGEDISGWQMQGDALGSNEGGTFLDESGKKWYVKFPRDEDHGRSEVTAGMLYQLAGIRMPKMKLVDLDGSLGVASEWIEGLKIDPNGVAKSPETWKGFGVDVLLANWDVAGLVYDNLLIDTDGRSVRLDPGGALEYRAQGELKGHRFGEEPSEVDSLRNPDINPESANVFKHMTDEHILAAFEIVERMDDNEIAKIIQTYGPKTKNQLLAKILKRKEWMRKFLEAE
jgi:hypothetical protein